MRFKETPCQSISEIVADYLDALRQSLDLPYAFYGHSLGGLVAFEIARRLEREGAKLPERLLIGACPPPALGLIHPRIAHLPDEEFLEAIQQRYAGIPEAVLKEPELMELFLPALKADYLAHESFERGQGPELESARKMVVSVPITVFAGVEDGEYLPEHLSRWREHTLAGFEAYTVAGDHFFLAKSAEFVRGKIRGELLGTEGRRI
jgi:surfactin synthase thioesterase subunit